MLAVCPMRALPRATRHPHQATSLSRHWHNTRTIHFTSLRILAGYLNLYNRPQAKKSKGGMLGT